LNASLRGASLAKSGLAGFHWCSKESLHKPGFSKVDTGFGIKTLLKRRNPSSHSLAKPGMSAWGAFQKSGSRFSARKRDQITTESYFLAQ
jgi:hypothetical protein